MRHMYFIGVSTGASSIHRIFPLWTRLAGVEDAALAGIDIPVSSEPAVYRAALEHMRDDADAWGGLVTTHKVAVWEHGRAAFTEWDREVETLGEVNCIVRRGARFTAMATDVDTSGQALLSILPEPVFRGAALIMGAGGAGTALAMHLSRAHSPREVILTDISAERLARVRGIVPARCQLVSGPEDHDQLLASLPPGALVVNATGMGKDRPGSPLTDAARFPADAIAWDFNYRGDLQLLELARAQGAAAHDGWEYFLRGWSGIMARVLGFDLTPALFQAMRAAAAE